MTRKIEIFQAIDRIDMRDSLFAIESIDGEYVAYNVELDEYGFDCVRKKFADKIAMQGRCLHKDSSIEPRRSDMINPKLVETITFVESRK